MASERLQSIENTVEKVAAYVIGGGVVLALLGKKVGVYLIGGGLVTLVGVEAIKSRQT